VETRTRVSPEHRARRGDGLRVGKRQNAGGGVADDGEGVCDGVRGIGRAGDDADLDDVDPAASISANTSMRPSTGILRPWMPSRSVVSRRVIPPVTAKCLA